MRRGGGTKALAPLEAGGREMAAKPRRIVRSSGYAVKPMTVEDAALRVDAGSDAFLVFRNAVTDSINILFRRRDGQLGLIEPEA